MLLIIDNQSSFIKKFKRDFLSEQNFKYVFLDHNEPIPLSIKKEEVKGVILSGGKGTPYDPLNLITNFIVLMNFDVPILGFCLGHEIIAVANMGRIKKLFEHQIKKEEITITELDDPIFKGLNKSKLYFTRSHGYYVDKLPQNFIEIGESNICKNEIIRRKEKSIYGFQAHPEVSGEDGILIIKNFLKICGFKI